MKKKIALSLICLLAAAAIPGADQKVKLPVQKPVAAVVTQDHVALPPHITRADCACLAGSGKFEVFGRGFGASQKNRVLRVNGVALPTVLSWGNQQIRCGHSYAFPGGVTVHVDIFDMVRNARVSNLFDYFLPFCIYHQDPAGALKPKSHLTLLVKPDVGAAASGRKVMIGDLEANANWHQNKIVILVPLLVPGAYSLRIEKNGQLISNEFAVTVL